MRSAFGSSVVPAILLAYLLTAGGSAAADTSSATPKVDEIFARHEAAVGYSLGDGKAAPMIAYWTTTWKDGQGHSDHAEIVTHQAGAFYRKDWSFLGAIESDGFDGRAFWSGTSNDSISAAIGFTRPYDVTSSIVQSEAFDSSLKATVQRITDTAYVVRISPADGVDADVYFNKSTNLIDRVVYAPDAYSVQDTYSDYRAEGPVTIAHTIRFNNTTSTLTQFEWNAQFDASELAPPTPHRFLWLPSNGAASVPFDQHDGVIVNASVNGQGGRMLLDTSTSGIELSEHFARIAGLKLPDNSDYIKASPTVGAIDVGDMHLRDVHVDVVNFDYFGPYEGVLGGDVFANAIVSIDFDKAMVTFTDPAKFHDDGSRPSISFSLDDGVPQSVVIANGKTAIPVVLSSGLMLQFAMRRVFDPTRKNGIYSGAYPDDTIASLALGPYTIPNVAVSEDIDPDGYSYIPVAPGTLGGTVLSNFNMTFDYPDRKLFLTPRRQ
jgi:hypothetical protein